MIVLNSQTIVFFDVDDTLVLWNASSELVQREGIEFTCPGSSVVIDDEVLESPSWTEHLVPHKEHIEQLKKHKSRHTKVVVWSAAGADWAETVVRTLNLEKYVDLVIAKPTWFYDDLTSSEFLPEISRKYFKYEEE